MIFKIGLRNLLRQKRRNMFLGIGISFGIMILVIANSFSAGLVDVLFNDVLSYAAGHIQVRGVVGNRWYSMFRDKEMVLQAIHDAVPEEEIVGIDESLGIFGRGLGNGKVDNIMVIGVEAGEEFFTDFFTTAKGNFDEYTSEEIEYPIIISEEKARTFNVDIYDTIRVRISTVTGQQQTASLTVIAIARADNSFMNMVMFLEASRVKELMGYKPYESADYQVNIRNPKENAKKYADAIHANLVPGILAYEGTVKNNPVTILAYSNLEEKKAVWKEKIRIIDGDAEKAFDKKGLLIEKSLALEHSLVPGDEFIFNYETKYTGLREEKYVVDAIFEAEGIAGNVILANEEKLHKDYGKYLAKNMKLDFFEKSSEYYPIMGTQWKHLQRSSNHEEFTKKLRAEKRIKTDIQKIDVSSMYEVASQIIQLEGVLNMLTGIAVLILFFIILVGVVNTLRMTIKERTREIGTTRAVGMRRADVRNTFLMETFLLTLFSCIVGTIIGIIVIKLLGLIVFETESFLGMILKDKRLFFKLELIAIFKNWILIIIIAIVTAFFPARRAANMSAASALRHYD